MDIDYDGLGSFDIRSFNWDLPRNAEETYLYGISGVVRVPTSAGYVVFIDPVALANGARTVVAERMTGWNGTWNNAVPRIPSANAVKVVLPVKVLTGITLYLQDCHLIPTFYYRRTTNGEMVRGLREGIMEVTLAEAEKWEKYARSHGVKPQKKECLMNGFDIALSKMPSIVNAVGMNIKPKGVAGHAFLGMDQKGWVMDKDVLAFIFPWNRGQGSRGGKSTQSRVLPTERAMIFDCADLWMDRTTDGLDDIAQAKGATPKEVWTEDDSYMRWRKFDTLEKAEKFASMQPTYSAIHTVWDRSVLVK